MTEPRYRTLIICSHPVQYMSPLLRRMAQHPQIDLQVAYCRLQGVHSGYDRDFATAIQWDVPLLDGYTWVESDKTGSCFACSLSWFCQSISASRGLHLRGSFCHSVQLRSLSCRSQRPDSRTLRPRPAR